MVTFNTYSKEALSWLHCSQYGSVIDRSTESYTLPHSISTVDVLTSERMDR